MESGKYCVSLTEYQRFKTRVVSVGDLKIGGNHPIVIQSMTTTDTMDTKLTVEQSIRMIDAGCELVRITAPSKKEAENLQNIKDELHKRGYNTPLVADIHFTPNAAEIAARIVEKVRINPGNYADKKKFEEIEYTDESYDLELERIKKRFVPLVRICKEHGTAMRIGTNHGSLSDRIMSRYGDTPLGMVESAMEFLRICEEENYFNIVLSMKASNPKVMIEAYRLLVNHMLKENMNYPLHLGVTEAGEGEDGRIKSAVGIGALLEDGLGDTVRVSLTEEPEAEIPVAQELVKRYNGRENHRPIPKVTDNPLHVFDFERRKTRAIKNIGDHNHPVVIADLSLKKEIKPSSLFAFGYNYSVKNDKWNLTDQAVDYLFINDQNINFEIPGSLSIIQNHSIWLSNRDKARHYPFIRASQYLTNTMECSEEINFIYACLPDLSTDLIEKLQHDSTAVLFIDTYNKHGLAEQRRMFIDLMNASCTVPVIIGRAYGYLSADQLQLFSSTDIGGLLVDGLGDGIFIAAENCGPDQAINQTAFGVLQATRTRISKTEYISCPSCGRTLFDLQEVTAKIRKRTEHLKGVKIGIMGCIVNGPGEMADADYGYVGTGVGKISLYKEKQVVQRNVPEANAVDELIELIKTHGDWVDPK
ncbi:MAG: 4-hydroxy-3-methylbut-2-en-1-yl diphosphate synthase [Crocinitomicaceae bacterium]|nr:4-hydroxy-3-methylbut-2-en-1-yl diphosphate synthase [Crocinitomicaceae bacterium]